jgi:hypothetical protein
MAGGGTSLADDDEPWWQPISPAVAGATGVGILLLLFLSRGSDPWVPILDSANLAFHEAGHMIYGILGDTLGLYGGTLGQLTFPAVLIGASAWRRQVPGVAIGVAWMAQNFRNVARYCADAVAQELPLVGGGDHDWTNILDRWNALHLDQKVAGVFRGIAWVLFLGAALFVVWRWRRSARSA